MMLLINLLYSVLLHYGGKCDFDLNEIEGIDKITIEDINFVKQLGFRIKLISECSIIDNKIYSIYKTKIIIKTKSNGKYKWTIKCN